MHRSSEQPLVLIVDDDPEFREELLPQALSCLDARVLKASNVEEALQVAAKHSAESADPLKLIVLDMHMHLQPDTAGVPRDAGVQFLQKLQKPDCPVIAVTAYVSFRDCVKVARAGAAAYIPKQEHDAYCGPEGGIDDLIKTCQKLLSDSTT